MLFQKVLGDTKAHVLTSVQLNFLENSQRIENVSHFYLVVREVSHYVRVSHENFHNFVAPLDHFEVLIIISVKVHVKRLIVTSDYKGLKELIKYRGCIIGLDQFFLDDLFSQELLALGSNA
jgi:hypothetical protein